MPPVISKGTNPRSTRKDYRLWLSGEIKKKRGRATKEEIEILWARVEALLEEFGFEFVESGYIMLSPNKDSKILKA